MVKIQCEMCGSNNLIKQDGEYVCQHCGTKYSTEEAKKLMVEVTGTVDVSGSKVKIDESDDIKKYYELARRARDNSDSENGSRYYGLILEKRPNDWEAAFYSLYFRCLNIKIAEIPNAVHNYTNSISMIVGLLNDDSTDEKEKIVNISNIIRCSQNLLGVFMTNTTTGSPTEGYHLKRINYALEFFSIGEVIIQNFTEKEKIINAVVAYWKGIMSLINTCAKEVNSSAYAARFKVKVDRCERVIKEYDNSYKSNITSAACYVATCVYGSYNCPQVWTLRRYRDNILAKTWYGRAFIHTYYAISPTIVNLFGDAAWFKKIWKVRLDKMVDKLHSKGVEDTPYNDK